jgi:aquaporin Z
MLELLKKLLVEFSGTLLFLYVFISTGNPLAIGAVLYVVILAGGKISGGHYNPAISIMMSMAGKLPYSELLFYIAAQVLGGLAAYQIYKLM